MAAKDVYHDAVKNALVKEGWTITNEPLTLPLGFRSLYVDLGAEKLLVASKDSKRIAVEVKSFVGHSTMSELEKAVGQYMFYDEALTRSETESDRQLFLGLPKDVVQELADDIVLDILTNRFKVNVLVYDPIKHLIKKWILSTTAT